VPGGIPVRAFAYFVMLRKKVENICSFGVALVVGSGKLSWGVVLLLCRLIGMRLKIEALKC
jgi:hypothetical protein